MEQIAIIKLGALGDVVRTLPILIGLKEKFPNSEITWITKSNAIEIIKSSPHVNSILTPEENISKSFDLLYNFDVDDEATDLAKKIPAKLKKGFYSQDGFLSAFNSSAEYYLNTIFDDELKKYNSKTYQQMMFETAELEYQKQHHPIILSEKELTYSTNFLNSEKINPEKLIGIHIGASSRWPSKKWHSENLKEFIIKSNKIGYEVLLLGGPNELDEIDLIYQELKNKGIKIYRQDPKCSILEFASLINLCNSVVCADSLALHISLALKKPTIGLFFVTSHTEVEDYGLLRKIIAPRHKEFFPEKSDQYSEELVRSIYAEEVIKFLENKKE